MRPEKLRTVVIPFCAAVILLIAEPGISGHSSPSEGIPAKVAAEYIHAVIDAGRQVYSRDIVERLKKKINLNSTEDWKEQKALPLPAQFLLASSQHSNKRGVGMRYRLMSLWPINPKNSPKSENEKIGLQEVLKDPGKPFSWVVQIEGWWYFQTVYPDIATTESCVSCHNNHPKSPKVDFKIGDVMGGITINFPLGRQVHKVPNQDFSLNPEVVVDYIHSILESDRAVYAQQVVARMEAIKGVHASENWEAENALPLPAQFLLRSAALIKKRNLGLDFSLISQWPINQNNRPANEFEKIGLETVTIHPIRPYLETTEKGRKRYLQGIYPDFAVSQACITCHNSHPKSAKRDFKLDDVMGAIRVTLPLE